MNIVISLLSTEEFSKERAYQTVFNGTRRRFEIPDAPQCVILDMIPEVLQILSENQRKRIFIHSMAGRSRCAVMGIAWLMVQCDLNVDTALEKLRKIQPCVEPNPGFMEQLRIFQHMISGTGGDQVVEYCKEARNMQTVYVDPQIWTLNEYKANCDARFCEYEMVRLKLKQKKEMKFAILRKCHGDADCSIEWKFMYGFLLQKEECPKKNPFYIVCIPYHSVLIHDD